MSILLKAKQLNLLKENTSEMVLLKDTHKTKKCNKIVIYLDIDTYTINKCDWDWSVRVLTNDRQRDVDFKLHNRKIIAVTWKDKRVDSDNIKTCTSTRNSVYNQYKWEGKTDGGKIILKFLLLKAKWIKTRSLSFLFVCPFSRDLVFLEHNSNYYKY